jgi:putative addiction module component (TIGR02574 family)
MNARAEQLLQEAIGLPESDRASLADALYASLEESSDSPEQVNAAWDAEIRRRVAEIEEGTAKTVSTDQLKENLDSIIRRAQAR